MLISLQLQQRNRGGAKLWHRTNRHRAFPAQDFGRADRSCFSLRKHTFASLQLSHRIVARLSIEFRSSSEASMYDCSEERTAGLDGSLSHVGSYLIR